MIWDSVPWQEELCRVADRLERRQRQKRWTDHSYFLLERDIMVSAYAVRKLIEAKKLSTKLLDDPVPVLEYPLTGKVPDLLSWHHIERSYDPFLGDWESLTLEQLCNQFIHSWVFVIEQVHGFNGIYVSSDKARKKRLYRVEAITLIEVFRRAGTEDIIQKIMIRDPKTGDLIVTKAVAAD